MADEGKEFPCKEPNCDQRVKYEPQEVRGFAQLAKRAPAQVKEDVYLTCPKGHTWPYRVQVRLKKE